MHRPTKPLLLFVEGRNWVVRDRDNQELIDLMQTDTVPTGYRANSPFKLVAASVRRKNPARNVEVML